MDIQLDWKPSSQRRQRMLQTAMDSFFAMLVVSVVSNLGVQALGAMAHMPTPAIEIFHEQLRWFLPSFLYIWIMFYMIEVAR